MAELNRCRSIAKLDAPSSGDTGNSIPAFLGKRKTAPREHMERLSDDLQILCLARLFMPNKSDRIKANSDGFPKTKNQWFRFYSEVLNDHKVQSLEPTVFKGWINLLCLANDCSGRLPEVSEIAFKLRLSVHSARELVDTLVMHGLIDIQPDQSLIPHNWAGRQFRSDTSTERVRKHRQKKQKPDPETDGNVSDETQRNVSVTPPEAETDTDSESEAEKETDTETEKIIAAAAADDVLVWLKQQFADSGEPAEFLADQIHDHGIDKVRSGWSDYKRKLGTGDVQTHSLATLLGFIASAMPTAQQPSNEPEHMRMWREAMSKMQGVTVDA